MPVIASVIRMTKRQVSAATELIRILLPDLTSTGFVGTFPDFRRFAGEHVDLLQFRFPAPGVPDFLRDLVGPLAEQLEPDFAEPDSFRVYASYMDRLRTNVSPFSPDAAILPLDELCVDHTKVQFQLGETHKIPALGQVFRYDREASMSDLAARVLSCIRNQGEPWWLEHRRHAV